MSLWNSSIRSTRAGQLNDDRGVANQAESTGVRVRPAICQFPPRAPSVDGASAITWTISRPSRYRSGRDLPTLRCGFPALISRQIATTVAVAFPRTLHRVWDGNEPASLLSGTACSPRSVRYRDAKTCPWLRPPVCDDSRPCWAPKIVASSDGDGAKPWGGDATVMTSEAPDSCPAHTTHLPEATVVSARQCGQAITTGGSQVPHYGVNGCRAPRSTARRKPGGS